MPFYSPSVFVKLVGIDESRYNIHRAMNKLMSATCSHGGTRLAHMEGSWLRLKALALKRRLPGLLLLHCATQAANMQSGPRFTPSDIKGGSLP